ncbi:MAG TPA: maleylpyruvate isomerase family mycothiol-dependent enzyme [Acidimicrobiales bacterium]
MDHREACDRLPSVIDRFAGVLAGADPTAEVPTCPGWSVAKLAKHVGITHRWASTVVRTRATERIDIRSIDAGVPSDPRDLPAWIRAGGEELVATLRDAPPGDATWAWGADQHVRFWSRRMLHEGTVHTADLELACGQQPSAIPPEQAVDAIDELLENLPHAAAFAPAIATLRGDGESLHLHATDVDGEWMIELHPDGFRWDHAHGKGTVAVRGRAGDVVLLLYNRLPASDERFTCFGEVALLERWVSASAH